MYEFRENDAYEFARFVGIPAKPRNDELFFKTCPYCKPKPQRGNLNTFSINLKTGQFKCLRASCGVSGNMVTLAKDFDFSLGSMADEYYRPKKSYRKFKKKIETIKPKSEAVKYLESRGIPQEVTERYAITVQADRPNILVFPFFDENGVMQFIKYRKTDFDREKDKNKEWCESDCKPILFGMYQCNDKFDRLIITEGQVDSLSVAAAGIENAVSVPNGAKGFTWLPYCWNWMNRFHEIIIFGDHEKGHITLLAELSSRLKTVVKHVREDDYLECKDANEILQKHGIEAVRNAVNNAVLVPIKRVIELSDVEDVDIYEIPKLRTGINQLDRLLYGGLPSGGVILISGKAGQGKLLADDTPVFTKSGWKNHGDLVVGDEVIGCNGEFVKVTNVFPKNYANMKVTFNNNDVIYCHENHEWITNLHTGNGYKEGVYTTKELMLKKQSGYKAPLRLICRKPLSGIPNALFVRPYTLGAWLGDGRNRHPDICSSKQDVCVVERIVNGDGYEISWHTEHKQTGVLYFGFKGLRFQLQQYGMCHSRRTAEKYIPHDYLIASLDDRLQLLAGLLDTDGYYDSKKNTYRYSTCSERLRDTFIDLIHTFGWNCYYEVQKAKKTSSGIQGRKNCYLISFAPHELTIPCQVPRKRQIKVRNHCKRVTAIRSIEYCTPRPGNCIEVEGGVYCAGKSMIPTHNSTLASQILANAIYQGKICFVYSGELPNYQFKAWLNFQIAGRNRIVEYQNKWGDRGYNISKMNREMIDDWYRDKCYLYDNSDISGDEKDDLLKLTENVIMQYGANVVLLDNLMTALDLVDASAYDKYDKQSLFVKQLARLALKHNVWILLVAHKRKNNFSQNENDEISGSGDISNLATITIAYERGKDIEPEQRLLKVSKNRLFGKVETEGFVLDYDEKSKRIYGQGDNLNFDFGWDRSGKQIEMDGFQTDDGETPFDT